MAWAGSIADPAQPEEAMVGTLDSWRFQDKEAARAAAEKAPLSGTARCLTAPKDREAMNLKSF